MKRFLILFLLLSFSGLYAQKKLKYESTKWQKDDEIGDMKDMCGYFNNSFVLVRSNDDDSIKILLFHKKQMKIIGQKKLAKVRRFDRPVKGKYILVFNSVKVYDNKIYCFWERHMGRYSAQLSKEVLYSEVLDSNLTELYNLREVCSFPSEENTDFAQDDATMKVTFGLNNDKEFYVWRESKDSVANKLIYRYYAFDKFLKRKTKEITLKIDISDSVIVRSFEHAEIKIFKNKFAAVIANNEKYCSLINLYSGESKFFKIFDDTLKHENVISKVNGDSLYFVSLPRTADKYDDLAGIASSVFDLISMEVKLRAFEHFSSSFVREYSHIASPHWNRKRGIFNPNDYEYVSEFIHYVEKGLQIEDFAITNYGITVLGSYCFAKEDEVQKEGLFIFELDQMGKVMQLNYRNRKASYKRNVLKEEIKSGERYYFKDIYFLYRTTDTLLLCPNHHKFKKKDKKPEMNELIFYSYKSSKSLDSTFLFKIGDESAYNIANGRELLFNEGNTFYFSRKMVKKNYLLAPFLKAGAVILDVAFWTTVAWSLNRIALSEDTQGIVSLIIAGGGLLTTIFPCLSIMPAKIRYQWMKITVVK
jgi:hypothetical protein